MKKTLLRYLFCVIGLLLCAFGVSFITKAALGNTPISAIPYTLSLIIPEISFGTFSTIILMIFILLQVAILKKKVRIIDIILQVPISFLFGFVVDFSMWMLTDFQPDGYLLKCISMLVGCCILSLGAYFEIVADVTMLPPDGFTQAIAKVSGKEFGNIKLITDASQVAIALILGLVFLHGLAGVREGTIIGVILNGNIIKLFGKALHLERIFENEKGE